MAFTVCVIVMLTFYHILLSQNISLALQLEQLTEVEMSK